MAEVLLISEKFIKENCEISNNVSGKFLQSAIKEAQDLKLTPILGDALVAKLKDLVGMQHTRPFWTNMFRGFSCGLSRLT